MMEALEDFDMYYPGIPSEEKWRDRKKKAIVEAKTPPLVGIGHHGGNDKNFDYFRLLKFVTTHASGVSTIITR
jgi:hypothetical protein